jgi:SHS2 domain-containing protein
MMAGQPAGFSEREHTADWELEVWAPNFSTLLEQAARGMYSLSGVRLQARPRLRRYLELSAADTESLLVAFLAELLYLGEQEGLGFDSYDLRLDGDSLKAQLGGAPLAGQDKEIKAVTYHNLKIEKGPRGLEARVVFDV